MGIHMITPHYMKPPLLGHYHSYTIWGPAGSIDLWSAILPSPFDALKRCPSGHNICQWTDALDWNLFAAGSEQTYDTDRVLDGPEHTHTAKRTYAITKWDPKMRIYWSLTTTCPLGHPRCAAFEGSYTNDQFAEWAGLQPVVTSTPFFLNAETHYHTFPSLRRWIMPRYIDSVLTCPEGHPRCQVTVIEQDPLIFRGTMTTIYTGNNEE
ncbi:hypothetical protein ES708_24926 [subsurface metagenome]